MSGETGPCIEEYEKSREGFWFCSVLILRQDTSKHVCLLRKMSQYRRKGETVRLCRERDEIHSTRGGAGSKTRRD